ncbi:saccharopine dehydrogenase family protein [Candidatus Woesearchaeota archaeon]|nr:saccharopine dehydrogenase family protein [Candidatus Woesearchaeota archaeon]
MSRVLLIGAGGVGGVVAHKCAQVPDVFSDIHLASRTLSKCKAIQEQVRWLENREITPWRVDADDSKEVANLIQKVKPELVINVALPYQDLSIMRACLDTQVNYLDTANYESPLEAKFCYAPQWAMQEEFEHRGIMAVLGCGFDPGVTGIFTAYAQKHLLNTIKTLDIMDCNAGNHRKSFATNFNPEINIREVTQIVKHWDKAKGGWIETPAIVDKDCVHYPQIYPEVGKYENYLLYHEELESLVKHFPEIEQARFWMTFSDNYLNHLRAFIDVGLTDIKPRILSSQNVSPRAFLEALSGKKYKKYEEILEKVGLLREEVFDLGTTNVVPLQFLKRILPEPSSLGENYSGKTVIGTVLGGIKDGLEKKIYIYNVCNHHDCYQEVKAQAISYTTGVPAMIGAKLMLTGDWERSGVFNVEQLDPDLFMEDLELYGLPWTIEESYKLI